MFNHLVENFTSEVKNLKKKINQEKTPPTDKYMLLRNSIYNEIEGVEKSWLENQVQSVKFHSNQTKETNIKAHNTVLLNPKLGEGSAEMLMGNFIFDMLIQRKSIGQQGIHNVEKVVTITPANKLFVTKIFNNRVLDLMPNGLLNHEVDVDTSIIELNNIINKENNKKITKYINNHKNRFKYVNRVFSLNPDMVATHKTGMVALDVFNTTQIKNKKLSDLYVYAILKSLFTIAENRNVQQDNNIISGQTIVNLLMNSNVHLNNAEMMNKLKTEISEKDYDILQYIKECFEENIDLSNSEKLNELVMYMGKLFKQADEDVLSIIKEFLYEYRNLFFASCKSLRNETPYLKYIENSNELDRTNKLNIHKEFVAPLEIFSNSNYENNDLFKLFKEHYCFILSNDSHLTDADVFLYFSLIISSKFMEYQQDNNHEVSLQTCLTSLINSVFNDGIEEKFQGHELLTMMIKAENVVGIHESVIDLVSEMTDNGRKPNEIGKVIRDSIMQITQSHPLESKGNEYELMSLLVDYLGENIDNVEALTDEDKLINPISASRLSNLLHTGGNRNPEKWDVGKFYTIFKDDKYILVSEPVRAYYMPMHTKKSQLF